MANAESVDGNAARLVFLRPRARDDGSNGGPAVIHIGEERTGELRYGSFFTFKLKLISEESALAHLEGLGWSK